MHAWLTQAMAKSGLSFLNQYRPKKQWRWNVTMHKDYRFCLSRRRKFSPPFLFCLLTKDRKQHTRNTRKMERINLMDVTQGKQNLTLETKNKTKIGQTYDTQGTTVQQSKLKLKLLQRHKGVVG